jgi:hypothetical protein
MPVCTEWERRAVFYRIWGREKKKEKKEGKKRKEEKEQKYRGTHF